MTIRIHLRKFDFQIILIHLQKALLYILQPHSFSFVINDLLILKISHSMILQLCLLLRDLQFTGDVTFI
jgi:hypothetical protein